MNPSIVVSTQAEALFVSDLQPSQLPTSAQIRTAVLCSLGRYRSMGCAALVAQEYGDHPFEAIQRMRWATDAVREARTPTVWGGGNRGARPIRASQEPAGGQRPAA